jgi:hypothetical protein
VFRDRYHAVVLDNPRQVRHAIAYVLLNARRHAAQRRSIASAAMIDPCSSGFWFDGWRCDMTALKAATLPFLERPDDPPIASARTWLLAVGWRKTRLIDPSEIPGIA